MKKILFLILVSVNIGYSQVKFKGDINYSQHINEKITSNNGIEYIFKLYEDHKMLVSLSNALNVDLDCFKNEIKETNVFTTLKIEF